MKHRILLIIVALITCLSAFSQSSYYLDKARSYMRDAEYYINKAEGYDREAEYDTKKAKENCLSQVSARAASYTAQARETTHPSVVSFAFSLPYRIIKIEKVMV